MPVEGALRPVTGDDIRMNTPRWLNLKDANVFGGPDLSWATLSTLIKLAVDGNAVGFAFPPQQSPTDTIFGIAANACGDYAVDIHDYGDMQRRIQLGKQLAPHLQGASENWQLVLCVGWPVPPANPPRQLDVTGAPTLIVHATHDPSTSYKNAFGLAAQIRGSSVLTRTGDGHTSYYTSDCARTAIDRYLVHPQAPAAPVCTT
jgi:pimeloyl-ACP methyl ester carboxylesterase